MKVALLNSGGLDSAMLAKYLHQQGHEIWSVFIDTNMVNAVASKAAAQITATNYCDHHYNFTLKFGVVPNYWESLNSRDYMSDEEKAFYPTDPPIRMYGSVTNPGPTTRPANEFHTFPNQGMVFISLGVGYAKAVGVTTVYSGTRLTADDEYLRTYNEVANSSHRISFRPAWQAPFHRAISYAAAAEILNGGPLTPADADSLRAEFAYTHSCRWNTPCGVCVKCTKRAEIGL
jgi:7-cyano-7-deazaguanine synthase in queuosine biosynthesis